MTEFFLSVNGSFYSNPAIQTDNLEGDFVPSSPSEFFDKRKTLGLRAVADSPRTYVTLAMPSKWSGCDFAKNIIVSPSLGCNYLAYTEQLEELDFHFLIVWILHFHILLLLLCHTSKVSVVCKQRFISNGF